MLGIFLTIEWAGLESPMLNMDRLFSYTGPITMLIDTNINTVVVSCCSPNEYMELMDIFLEMNHYYYENVVINEK